MRVEIKSKRIVDIVLCVGVAMERVPRIRHAALAEPPNLASHLHPNPHAHQSTPSQASSAMRVSKIPRVSGSPSPHPSEHILFPFEPLMISSPPASRPRHRSRQSQRCLIQAQQTINGAAARIQRFLNLRTVPLKTSFHRLQRFRE